MVTRFFKLGLLIFLADLPTMAFSNLPGDPYRFDMKTCVEQNIENCLKGVCIPSTPTDCSTQCKVNAVNKCKAISQQEKL
ncbi:MULTISPECIES: hypothetical protein [Legionella]|uniref:Uncharacterized protein n=1 Tax=Legionella drozanskii LLAP-1 TaxID=1212489 RepID=A0A0W0SVW6_9GAMM|nr:MULTISPECIES: hypothetical protein [Legionella]KTC87530.1 hypothetical protein Ldro_1149 [Legionella drozanskii LLAP-1]PJE10437.1 MAG: hypothetical protein CK430_10160 [Legionella sp.]